MEAAQGMVRVMTIHGAKGLEAPIVILPDTTGGKGGGGPRPQLVPAVTQDNKPDMMLWLASKDQDDPVAAAARAAPSDRTHTQPKSLRTTQKRAIWPVPGPA